MFKMYEKCKFSSATIECWEWVMSILKTYSTPGALLNTSHGGLNLGNVCGIRILDWNFHFQEQKKVTAEIEIGWTEWWSWVTVSFPVKKWQTTVLFCTMVDYRAAASNSPTHKIFFKYGPKCQIYSSVIFWPFRMKWLCTICVQLLEIIQYEFVWWFTLNISSMNLTGIMAYHLWQYFLEYLVGLGSNQPFWQCSKCNKCGIILFFCYWV